MRISDARKKAMRERGMLSVAEASAKTGISIEAIYAWVKQGDVRHEESVGAMFVSESDVQAKLGPLAERPGKKTRRAANT